MNNYFITIQTKTLGDGHSPHSEYFHFLSQVKRYYPNTEKDTRAIQYKPYIFLLSSIIKIDERSFCWNPFVSLGHSYFVIQ